jgi:molybdate transport system substrate-binding protein
MAGWILVLCVLASRVGRSGARFVVALALAALAPSAALAAHVTVFGAASLKEALDDQVRRFEKATGNEVVVSYGASNTLARQIEAGAPADIFISADLAWMDYLEQRHLLMPRTRIELLRNTLVLVAPASSSASLAIVPKFDLAGALAGGRLAMANPDSVPAGKYGRSALEHLGVWNSVEQQVARAENVRAALALVSRGEAPFGIVYATTRPRTTACASSTRFRRTAIRRSSIPRRSPPTAGRPPCRCSTTCARRSRDPPGSSMDFASRTSPCRP